MSLLLAVPAHAQTSGVASPKPAEAQGTRLQTATNVGDEINVEAVLLPSSSAQRIFGKRVGTNYVVVQVTVSNQSSDSSFILNSLYLDYAAWGLSGMQQQAQQVCKTESPDAFVKGSCPGQVSSIEYRLVRGEVQDASVWNRRNFAVRTFVFAGAIATGLPALHSRLALDYLSHATGQVEPGLEVFWPDPTVAQLNRVSDLGFQTNKAFPKGSADVVYAFFPVDRFLTPGLRRIFLRAPALFFAPPELLVDNQTKRWHEGWWRHEGVSQADLDQFLRAVETAALADPECRRLSSTGAASPNLCSITGRKNQPDDPCSSSKVSPEQFSCYVNKISLNNIRVFAGGVMAVNAASLAPVLNAITMDEEAAAGSDPKFWGVTATAHTGKVTGRFLTGGKLSISRISTAGTTVPVDDFVEPITMSTVGANDATQPFSLTLKKALPVGAQITFTMTKYDPEDTAHAHGITASIEKDVPKYTPPPAPAASTPAAATPAVPPPH